MMIMMKPIDVHLINNALFVIIIDKLSKVFIKRSEYLRIETEMFSPFIQPCIARIFRNSITRNAEMLSSRYARNRSAVCEEKTDM